MSIKQTLLFYKNKKLEEVIQSYRESREEVLELMRYVDRTTNKEESVSFQQYRERIQTSELLKISTDIEYKIRQLEPLRGSWKLLLWNEE